MSAPGILIVQDEAELRAQLRELVRLAYPQAFIAEAGDGTNALVACAAHHPDIVLMDVELPGFDGILLAGYIRERHARARVIIVSHRAAPVYRERAAAAGAFGYVSQDRMAIELVPLIARALASQG